MIDWRNISARLADNDDHGLDLTFDFKPAEIDALRTAVDDLQAEDDYAEELAETDALAERLAA